MSCSAASTSAERSSDRCPALPQKPAAFSINPGFGAVTRQQFRLALGDFGELAFEGFGNAGMKRASRLAQQRAISRVLHQGMLEQVARMRRHALPEQQTGGHETV